MDSIDRSLTRIITFALLCLLSAFALAPSKAQAQADWLSPDGMTKVMEGTDDGTFHVSLGHAFPYYGGVFTDAWMSSNGVIILYDPVKQFGNPDTYNPFCCSGIDFSTQTNNKAFSFLLAPLWTDLVDINLTSTDGYYYKTSSGGSSFLWYNVAEYYNTNNLNTFQANLWPDGSFDFLYDDVNVTNHQVTIGFSGDTTLSDYQQMVHQYSFTNQNLLSGNWWDQLVNPGGVIWHGQDGGYESSLDCSNALNNPICPGYQEAYLDQQCSFNSLYSQQCPGYAQAYYDQQCSQNALYDSGCTGYEAAYFVQQCELNPLHDSLCNGYRQALAIQEASGMNFVYGDDVNDFIDTDTTEDSTIIQEMNYGYGEEEDYGYTEGLGNENTGAYEEIAEEFNSELGILSGEESGQFLTESTIESTEESFYTESIDGSTEEDISDESIVESDEDIALEEEEGIEEVTSIEDEDISEDETTPEGTKVDAIGIALATASSAESNTLQISTDSNRQSQVSETTQSVLSSLSETISSDMETNENDILEIEEKQDSFSFSVIDSAYENATIETLTDPSITISEFQSLSSSTTEQSQKEESAIDMKMESSTPQMDTGFAAQQNQSFSTGQSITAVLNNVPPNFSKFDIAPPGQTEQQQTDKAESQANNMSDEQLQANLEEFNEEMQESGGFGDQSLTIFLMGRNSEFTQYNNITLKDASFYIDRGMPGGSVQNDRNTMLQLMGTSGKHEEMIDLQYRR